MGYVASALFAFGIIGLPPMPLKTDSAWQGDYGRALETTRKAQRPLLVVLDNPAQQTQRINPIRFVQQESVNQDAKQLDNYVLCHVDVSTSYGKRVAKAFKATEFPYTAIIDKSGEKVIYRKAGAYSDSQWRTVLTTYRKGTRLVPGVNAGFIRLGTGLNSFGNSNCPSCQRGW